MAFTTDPKARKNAPVFSGVLNYFPDAIFEVAELSQRGNDQHNPGEPLHWAKGKSQDDLDACVRHLLERGSRDIDGVRHATKAAWRALAYLQKEIEAERAGITVDELNARYKAEELAKKAQPTSYPAPPPDSDYYGPCMQLVPGNRYKVVAAKYPLGPLRVGDTFYASPYDVRTGFSSDGFRYVNSSWIKVKPC